MSSFNVPSPGTDLYFERYQSGRPKYTTCPEGGAMFQIPDSNPPFDRNVSGYVPPVAEDIDWGDG